MDQILKINEIFTKYCSYEFINKYNTNMRNIPNGIQLTDAFYYKFAYSQLHTTKDGITSDINYRNGTSFTRKAYETKENNIPNSVYNSIFDKLKMFYYDNCVQRKQFTEIAVDGTNNNNNKHQVALNMGYYDMSNDVPIDLTFNNTTNRNKEVKELIKYIELHPDEFKNTIIIGDRLYFTYKLLYFLDKMKIKFIIRVKGDGENLTPLNKKVTNYEEITYLRNIVRVVTYNGAYEKQVKINGKKNKLKTKLKVNSSCTLVTNIPADIYDNDMLLISYKKRWTIETYFKLVKNNCKLQHMKEKKVNQYKRINKCDLIITYILKIIEYFFIKEKEKININKSNTLNKNKKK